MASTPIYNWPTPDNTDLVKNGALAIRTLGDSIDTTMDTMIEKSLVDAKGDLVSATANDTPARLAVGADGETLVADASTATGLRYTENYAAGKNKFINGDLYVNQRAFTTTSTTLPTTYSDYGVDRWRTVVLGTTGTTTMTKNIFTPGTAPVAGYEGKNYFTIETSTQSGIDILTLFRQSIEDVRTTAGNTYTISFYAKAASGTPSIAISVAQLFGTGGSPSANAEAPAGKVAITTSWVRYSITYAIPSISGKTLGTDENSNTRIQFFLSAGTNFNTNASSLGVQNNTFDLWGFQIEEGSVATAFQTATGSIQGETSACQRYYYRFTPTATTRYGSAVADTTTTALGLYVYPVTMRANPTALEQSGVATDYSVAGAATTVCSVVPVFSSANVAGANVGFTVASGLVAGQALQGRLLTGGFLGWSAEL